MFVKYSIAVLLLVTFSTMAGAQSRIYFNIGSSYNTTYFTEGFYRLGVGSRIYITDTEYQSKKIGRYWNADLTIDFRINNLIRGVTGLSIFQAGYHNSIDNFYSDLAITYLGVPLQLRVNFVSSVNLDVGFLGLYPITAILDETRNRGTVFELSASDEISSQFSQFNLASFMQASFLFNRITISAYIITGSSRIEKDFKEQWIIGGGSMFLRHIYPKFKHQSAGIKLGVRL